MAYSNSLPSYNSGSDLGPKMVCNALTPFATPVGPEGEYVTDNLYVL